jgi:GAF domain-containing protein
MAASAWTLLTGRPPPYGGDATLAGVAGATPELEEGLHRGLAFNPEERLESAAALAAACGAPIDTPSGASLAVSVGGAGRGLLESVVRDIAGAFEAASVSIAVVDGATRELTYVAAWGAGAHEVVGMRLAPGVGLAGAAAESGQAVFVPDCRADPRFAAQVASRIGYVPHTMLVLPLRRDGMLVGVLSLLDRRGGEPYGAQDLARAELFAEVAAASLS